MSRSLLERVEELAVARYGKGAVISVDRERRQGLSRIQTYVRVWDAKGEKVLETHPCDMKIDAVREAMRLVLLTNVSLPA